MKLGLVMNITALALCLICLGCNKSQTDTNSACFMLEIDEALLRERLRDENPEATNQMLEDMFNGIAADANNLAVDVIRTRLKSMGIKKPTITHDYSKNRITVQLPRATAEQITHAEKLFRQDGYLEFRLVSGDNASLASMALTSDTPPPGYVFRRIGGENYFGRVANYSEIASESGYAVRLARFGMPIGDSSTVMMLMQTRVGDGKEVLYKPVFVNRRPVAGLSGDNLRKAKVESDSMTGQPMIAIEFDDAGAKAFAQITSRNIGRQMAIILDGVVYSAPMIRDAITGGRATIS